MGSYEIYESRNMDITIVILSYLFFLTTHEPPSTDLYSVWLKCLQQKILDRTT